MDRLILGLAVFFGGHSISLLAFGWRDRMAKRLGIRAWQSAYSILALFGFYLLITGYGAARPLAAVLPGRIQARAGHPLLLGKMLWAVVVRQSLARRPARRMIALPAAMANDVIAVVGGLALYAAFIFGLHARLFGVPVLGVNLQGRHRR